MTLACLGKKNGLIIVLKPVESKTVNSVLYETDADEKKLRTTHTMEYPTNL
jgi:hypothetical protein